MKEIKEFEENIRKETINNIIKSIKINDSYFYAEMVIMRHFDAMDPFGGEKIVCNIRINLYNSKEFVKTNIINDRPKALRAREIKSKLILDSIDLIKNKEDAMMLIYEEVGKEIAKDLFQQNAREINMTIQNTSKRYI